MKSTGSGTNLFGLKGTRKGNIQTRRKVINSRQYVGWEQYTDPGQGASSRPILGEGTEEKEIDAAESILVGRGLKEERTLGENTPVPKGKTF